MESVDNISKYIMIQFKNMYGYDIDEMRLHKLLYFSQKESLALTGQPMFLENFRGWKFGPVCLEARRLFKQIAKHKVNMKIDPIESTNEYIVNNILLGCGSIESWDLSEISHHESCWVIEREGSKANENGNEIIPIENILKDAQKIRPYDYTWDMYYDEFDNVEEM